MNGVVKRLPNAVEHSPRLVLRVFDPADLAGLFGVRVGAAAGLFFSLSAVSGLAGSYRAMRLWIKPDGLLSHTIDFRCHSTARVWHGHWRYSDRIWKLIPPGVRIRMECESSSRSCCAVSGGNSMASRRTRKASSCACAPAVRPVASLNVCAR